MVKKLLFLICFLFFASLVFCQQEISFEINGFVENDFSGAVFLQYTDNKGNLKAITGNIKNHRFSFKGQYYSDVQASLFVGGFSSRSPFYLDSGKIELSVRVDTSVTGSRVFFNPVLTNIRGSKSQTIWDELMTKHDSIAKNIKTEEEKSKEYFTVLSEIINANPDRNVTSAALVWVSAALNRNQIISLLEKLSPKQQTLAKNGEISKTLERLEKTIPGSPVYFPPQKDTAGNPIELSALKYEYLLIDFWASWCGPCHEAHPGMIDLYKKYNPSGFEIVSVSLDDKKSEWIKSIDHDKLPWLQLSDLKGFYTDIVNHYSLNFVPYNLLIDKEGKIVASELREDGLKKKLNELFNH